MNGPSTSNNSGNEQVRERSVEMMNCNHIFSRVFFLQVSMQPVLASVVKVNPVTKVRPVEPPSFVVTLIRRPYDIFSDENRNIPHEIRVENCQPTDLMSTVLQKARAIDSHFYCCINCCIRMRIFIRTNEGETELVAFHSSVENIMLWELGILPSNNVIHYTQIPMFQPPLP